MAEAGIPTFAWKGETEEEFWWCIDQTIFGPDGWRPNMILDDGGDLTLVMHEKYKDEMADVKGISEETTTGVIRLRAMAEQGQLAYPIIAVNDAMTKHFFDNRYGTGQSTIDGIVRATNILIAGKTFVVCDYGSCGKGVSLRAKSFGANVIVCEVDNFRALQASYDGFRVETGRQADRSFKLEGGHRRGQTAKGFG